MSDEEYEYDYGSDAEYDYGSDDGNDMEDDVLIEIENSFFEAEDMLSDNKTKSIELFEKVVALEEEKGENVKWRFKALQHLVVLHFSNQNFETMISKYQKMLSLMNLVTRNECTDAINIVLDTLVASNDVDVLSKMYEITLESLKNANNERLWLNTNLKLAKVYLDAGKYGEVERILSVLKKMCQNPDGTDDMNKGASLLEVYCIEIQLCSATRNAARLRQIYPKTLNFGTAVADPRIIGIIREEGGKMLMAEGSYDEAYNELYESFRSYQEAGNMRAKVCLKYVVVAGMLAVGSASRINPFDAREAKVYAEDKEIVAMSDLRSSLESNDLKKFERILANKQNCIATEPYIMTYVEPLRKRMREEAILSDIKPYAHVSFKCLGDELNLSVDVVEGLLIDLIMDGRLKGTLNQINKTVTLDEWNHHNQSRGVDISQISHEKWNAIQECAQAIY